MKLKLKYTLIMKPLIISITLVAAFFIAGCSRPQQSIIGRYKSKEYSFISRCYLNLMRNTSFIIVHRD